MQQHPVPQNVTQYQFRLVGDMTLKQFLELAGGMVVAYLFFASNLLFFIKWPLALGSLLLGVGLAFFPIEERPLDVWIINFLKSIYAPTRFVWQKTTKLPDLFSFKAHDIVEKKTSTKTVKAPTLPVQPTPTTDYSEDELAKLKSLESLLTSAKPTTNKAQSKPNNQELKTKSQKPTISVRKLSTSKVIFDAQKPLPTQNKTAATIKTATKPSTQSRSEAETPPLASGVGTPHKATISKDIFVSNPTVTTQKLTATGETENIKLPASPKKPNIVVGMAIDKEGAIVSGAIIEIINSDGISARAIKANSLGQFYISTPLPPGKYVLEVEKDGFTFPRQSLTINNKLISPILLRAK